MKLVWRSRLHRDLAAAVFAALLAVLSQIALPMPWGIPITLQTFAVALCGYALGPALGSVAVGVYLALGAVGLPVFSGFAGGAASLLNVTGGFLWGFLPMALLCGLGSRRGKLPALLLGLCGLVVCHGWGVVQFALVQSLPLWTAFLTASAPYLVKDLVSLAAAYAAARAVVKALGKARLGETL